LLSIGIKCFHSSVSYTRTLSCNNKNNNNNDNQLDVMTLAAEQLQFVQHQLNYHFRDISRLVLCFRAAHRSDFDGVADDGNRKFAKTGVTIMDLVEKRCFSMVGTESRGRVEGSVQKTARADTRKIPLARGQTGQKAKTCTQPHATISASPPSLLRVYGKETSFRQRTSALQLSARLWPLCSKTSATRRRR
jgi:hypothetical protein